MIHRWVYRKISREGYPMLIQPTKLQRIALRCPSEGRPTGMVFSNRVWKESFLIMRRSFWFHTEVGQAGIYTVFVHALGLIGWNMFPRDPAICISLFFMS